MYKKSKKSRKREKEIDNFSYSKNKTYKNFFNPHLTLLHIALSLGLYLYTHVYTIFFMKGENRSERGHEQICSFLLSYSLSTTRSYSLPPILVCLFVCLFVVSPTRSAILTSQLCIRLSTSVMCCSSPHWPLLLFAGYVLFWIKVFLLFRSTLMGDLWDEC
jgi:hypothetical protein